MVATLVGNLRDIELAEDAAQEASVVVLNRAIAVAELEGPEAGLAVLEGLELDHYRCFHAARAELLRRAARTTEARGAYLRAHDLAQTEAEPIGAGGRRRAL